MTSDSSLALAGSADAPTRSPRSLADRAARVVTHRSGSQVGTAARNLWALTVGGGVEPYVPSPSTTIYDRPHQHLQRFDRDTPATGNPVLLVPPLAVTISCYDLRPDQSLVQFLLGLQRETYVVDYGDITRADAKLGFEFWTDDVVPAAVHRISADNGGRPVDVIGWSYGGTISLLTATAHPELPIASVTALGTPFDESKNPGLALPRLVGSVTGGREVAVATSLLGGIPKHAVRAGFRFQALGREIRRPLFVARNATNTEALARMEAIDRFIHTMPGYPARFYRQSYQSLVVRNEMFTGTVHLDRGTSITLAHLRVPVLLIGSPHDLLAPAPSVASGIEVLTGSPLVRFEEVPGSHLGIVAGADAATTSWPHIADFLGSNS